MRSKLVTNADINTPDNPRPAMNPDDAPANFTDDRISEALGADMLMAGGVGWIGGRRGLAPGKAGLLTSFDTVKLMAMQNPLELLSMLPYINPEVGYALWNILRLGCTKDSIRYKAMTRAKPTPAEIKGDPALKKMKPDTGGLYPAREAADGTAIIKDFFNNLNPEVGGLVGCVTQLTQEVCLTGFAANEFVPYAGPFGTGDLWPLDSLSVELIREQDGYLYLYQRQNIYTKNTVEPTKIGNFVSNGVVRLPPVRTFWSALDARPNNPMGMTPFGTVITELLVMLAFLRDLMLGFHRVGVPRIFIGWDAKMWSELADLLCPSSDKIERLKWINAQKKKAQEEYKRGHADSAYWGSFGDKITPVGTGGQWPDVLAVMEYIRWRMTCALKTLPALFGIMENGSGGQTWGTTQWKQWTAGLGSIVVTSAEPPRRAMECLLQRVHGLPYTVETEWTSPRVTEQLADAQTEQIEIFNATLKRDENFITQDEASIAVTGSAAVGDAPSQMQVPPTQKGDDKGNPDAQGGGADGKGASSDSNPQAGQGQAKDARARARANKFNRPTVTEKWRARMVELEQRGIDPSFFAQPVSAKK